MPKKYHHKLIRDKVKATIENNGATCEVRSLTDLEEYVVALRSKIVEEAKELASATDRQAVLAEYADLSIVLDAFTRHFEIAPAEIEVALTESLQRKGGFGAKHFLEWTDENHT